MWTMCTGGTTSIRVTDPEEFSDPSVSIGANPASVLPSTHFVDCESQVAVWCSLQRRTWSKKRVEDLKLF